MSSPAPGDPAPRRTVTRTVESADGSLSPEANARLTEELREVIGSDEVQVPAGTPDHAHERHGTHRPFAAALASHRLAVAIPFVALVIVGAIASLALDSWLFIVLAVAVHAIGTFVILSGFLHLAGEPEHVDPTTAALLEDEGVADPDRVFTDLLADFADAAPGDGDEVRTSSRDDPGRRAVEDRTAITPSSEPSEAIGGGMYNVPRFMVLGTALVGFVAAVAQGGRMWLAAVFVLLCLAGWLVFSRLIDGEHADERAGARRHLPLVLAGLIGLITLGVLIAVAVGYA